MASATTELGPSSNIANGGPRTKSIITTKGSKGRKKIASVSFMDGPPEIQEVRIDDEELKRRWYSNGEYFFIKKEAMNSVRRMSTTRMEESDNFTSRGLEIVDDEQVRRRKETIDGTVQRILKAQDKRGSNPEMLSPLYKQITQSCLRESIRNAKQDERDANDYMDKASGSTSRGNASFMSKLCGCLSSNNGT